MINWYQQLAGKLSMNMDTVEIAVSYLDRYMISVHKRAVIDTNRIDRNIFQRLCITCLYIAAKIHEPKCMDLDMMAAISNGQHSVQEIKDMEVSILTELNWRMNPPTTASFIHLYLSLLPNNLLNSTDYNEVLTTALAQARISLNNLSLIGTKSSIISYCSLMNTLECCGNKQIDKYIGLIGSRLASMIDIKDCNDSEIVQIQDRLYRGYIHEQSKYSLRCEKFVTTYDHHETEESSFDDSHQHNHKLPNRVLERSPRRISDHCIEVL